MPLRTIERTIGKKHILTPDDLEKLEARALPKSLLEAAGLLKKNYRDLVRYYEKSRKEWPVYSKR